MGQAALCRGGTRAGRIALVLLVVVVGSACEKKTESAASAVPEVLVTPVEKRDVDLSSEWIGTTVGYVNAEIRPKIEGYLLRQAYRDGAAVMKGDLLFEIDPRQFKAALDQATGQLGRAKASLGKSELDVARYTPLAAEGAVSQEELDNAVQARFAAAAQVVSAEATVEQAKLDLDWTRVTSPIDGVAAIATAQIGDLVSPTTLLTSVSQLDPIKVAFPMSEIDYLRLARPASDDPESAERRSVPDLGLILANGEVHPHRGQFSVVGLDVNQTTGTIEVQGIFPNPRGYLRPGQFAKVRVAIDRRDGALLVPQRAVTQLQGVSQVAVVGDDDQIAIKTVLLGPRFGSEWIVESGLTAGDRVVVEGLQKVRAGMKVVPKPAPASDTDPAESPNTAPKAGS